MAGFWQQLHVPGAFWVALIVFVLTWLPQLFPTADWLDEALLALYALLKAVEVLVGVTTPAARRVAATKEALWRLIL